LDKIHIIGDTIRKMHLKRVTMSIILLIWEVNCKFAVLW
jgi:hypothetical protein